MAEEKKFDANTNEGNGAGKAKVEQVMRVPFHELLPDFIGLSDPASILFLSRRGLIPASHEEMITAIDKKIPRVEHPFEVRMLEQAKQEVLAQKAEQEEKRKGAP